jgi:hypothetical protein
MLLQRLALLYLYTCLPLYHHVSSTSVLGRLSSQVRKMRFGGGTRLVDLYFGRFLIGRSTRMWLILAPTSFDTGL